MNSERWLPMAPGLLLLLVTGCTPERNPAEYYAAEGVGTLVVDAVLIVDEPLPEIRLSRTLPAGEPFTWEAAAVDEASVVVIVATTDTLDYIQEWSTPGIYRSAFFRPPLVNPEMTYELLVKTQAGELLSAATVTPKRFGVDSWVLLDSEGGTRLRTLRTFAEDGDGVYDAPDNQLTYAEGLLEARFTGTAAALGAAGFQLALFSLDPGSDFVIDPPFFDDEDFASLERSGSSPAFSAENGTVRLPWFAIYFQGRHLYRILAVDRNWYDYVRSLPEGDVGLGFGGNAGDGFASPIFHVEGGIGLFGSAAADSLGFRVLPAP